MTADRLELDALEERIARSVEVQSAYGYTADEARVEVSPSDLRTLIAASRDAKTLTDERYEWERMVVEREEHTHRQIAKTKMARAEAERDAAQAALARVTSVENEARLVKIITDAVNKQPDNRSRVLEAADGVLVALREITGEGQEAGD